MASRAFQQVDVFTDRPYFGNPLAVVLDGNGLTDEQMQRFAHWTNLSETTFLIAPTDPAADYRVRIFTTSQELPFAGHPTLGSCHAWLRAGGIAKQQGIVMQECAIGLVPIRVAGNTLAFAAPPLRTSGPLDTETFRRVRDGLGLSEHDIVAHSWVVNGPEWIGIVLPSAERVLSIEPKAHLLGDVFVGVIGPYERDQDSDETVIDYEVRVFCVENGQLVEDPVTGSLNAGVASWLVGNGIAPRAYVAQQGTRLGRKGRVEVSSDENGQIWIGGSVVGCVSGSVEL